VVLSVPNQLVYSARDYGPNLFAQSWFNASTTPASLGQVWTKYWAYLSLSGIAPVWLGEFGTTNNASDLQSSAAGSQGQWFESLIAFLSTNRSLNWTYWALNGEDSYALLDSAYDATPPSAEKQQMLASIQFQPGASASTTPSHSATATPTGTSKPTPQPTSTAVGASCRVAYSVGNDWGSGFTAAMTITNTGSTAINGWRLTWAWPGNQTISGSAWNASASQSGQDATLTNAPWNPAIAAGGTQTGIGFNANYSGANQAPAAFFLNGTQCVSSLGPQPTPTPTSTVMRTATATANGDIDSNANCDADSAADCDAYAIRLSELSRELFGKQRLGNGLHRGNLGQQYRKRLDQWMAAHVGVAGQPDNQRQRVERQRKPERQPSDAQ
jgi:endoglucanase